MNLIKLGKKTFGYDSRIGISKLAKLLRILNVGILNKEYEKYEDPLLSLAYEMVTVGYLGKGVVIIDRDNGSVSIPIAATSESRTKLVNCLIGLDLDKWRKFVKVLKVKGLAC